MKKYIEQLKVRNRLSIAALMSVSVILIVGNRYLSKTIQTPDVLSAFIDGFQVGILGAMVIFFVVNMVKIRRALQDETKLEEMYIKENDERKVKIAKEVGNASSLITLIGLAIATVVAGYINYVVFLSLLGALMFFVLVKAVCKIYYNKKY